MRSSIIVASLLLVACTHEPIGPDPTGGGASAATSSTSTGGPAQGSFTSGTRLKVRSISGTDGSSAQIGFFDSGRGENCAFATAADAKPRCLPVDARISTTFVDAACSQPAINVTANCLPPPKYLLRQAHGGCIPTDGLGVFPLGSNQVTNPQQYYLDISGACQPGSVGGTWRVADPEVAPSSFVDGVEGVDL